MNVAPRRSLSVRARRATGRRVVPLAALAALAAVLAAPPAAAHTPHDVIKHVAVSPDFPTDGTVFGVLQLSEDITFGRSFDGGRTWNEIAQPFLSFDASTIAFSSDYANDHMVFVSTNREGIWRSEDRGATFVKDFDGLPTDAIRDVTVSPDFANDGTVVVVTNQGIGVSTDKGDNWVPTTQGLAETGLRKVAFAPTGMVFAAGKTMHVSTDGGLSWTPLASFSDYVSAIAISPDFATDQMIAVSLSGGGVAISTDAGVSFLPSNTGLTDLVVNEVALAADGTLLCATKTDGCFRATAPFAPWTLQLDGIEPPSNLTSDHYRTIDLSPDFANDGVAFLGTFEGLYRTDDKADLWRQRDVFHQRICRSIVVPPSYADDGSLLIADYGGGLLVATPADKAVAPTLGTAGSGTVSTLDADGGAGTGAGLHPAGTTAPDIPSAHLAPARRPGAARPALAAATAPSVHGALARPAPGAPGPYEPTLFDPRAEGITPLSMFAGPVAVSPAYGQDGTLFYGHQGLWRSTDRGHTWTSLPILNFTKIVRGITCSPDLPNDHTVFHGTGGEGVYRSTDLGDSWQLVDTGLPVNVANREIVCSPDFASDQTVFLASRGDGLFKSTDGGTSWFALTNGVNDLEFRELAISPDFTNDGTVFAGAAKNGLYVSNDGGASWFQPDLGFVAEGDVDILGLAVSPAFATDHTVIIATNEDGPYRSTDGGLTWSPIGAGLTPQLPRMLAISPAFAADRTLFLSTHDWVWKSVDAGDTWFRLPGFIRVPDTHPQVFYTPAWPQVAQPGCHGTGTSVGTAADDSCFYEFNGRSIVWYATRDPESGLAEVWLDGELQAMVDLYSPETLYQQPVWSRVFPDVEAHDIEIVVSGLTNPESSGILVYSDGFALDF